MTGFKLIAVLVIVGGAIAFFGDRIGMRVGRKRLTLWGLRPRHTSLIITVLTGIIIAAGSLGVLSLSSNNVRVALFHIQQIQDELKSRTADLNALNDKLAAEQAALQLAKDQLDQVKSDYEKTKNDKDLLQSQVTNLKDVESRLTDTVGDMTTTVDRLQGQIDALNQQLKSLQQQAQNGNWIFLKGRLLAADAVAGGRSADETIRALYNLAAAVEQIARANGAGPTPQDPNEIVRYDPASLSKVQNDLMHGKGMYVVRVVVAQNSQKGEPLTIAFVDFPDQMLFQRGEVVASIDYAPGDDAQTVVLTMLARMQNMLVDKGILTRMGGAPAGQSVQGPNFLSVITELQSVKSKVTVQVIAKEPITRVAGLGEIDLQVTG